MSQENVEIVRSAYAAVNEGDLEALAESQHATPFLTGRGRSDPRRASIAATTHSLNTWPPSRRRSRDSSFRRSTLWSRPAARSSCGTTSARGRASGLEIDRVPDVALVWELRDGKVTKTTLYRPHSRGPRSRGAVGVGDVAGERGDRASEPRGVQLAATSRALARVRPMRIWSSCRFDGGRCEAGLAITASEGMRRATSRNERDVGRTGTLKTSEFFDAGEDRVVGVFRLVGKGKHSGAAVEREIGLAYRTSETGSCGECGPTSTPAKPSKPWGCRSRRCRRRTSRSCDGRSPTSTTGSATSPMRRRSLIPTSC